MAFLNLLVIIIKILPSVTDCTVQQLAATPFLPPVFHTKIVSIHVEQPPTNVATKNDTTSLKTLSKTRTTDRESCSIERKWAGQDKMIRDSYCSFLDVFKNLSSPQPAKIIAGTPPTPIDIYSNVLFSCFFFLASPLSPVWHQHRRSRRGRQLRHRNI